MAYLCTHLMKTDRGVEQLVARWAHNPKVAGSSPAPATKKRSTKGRPFLFPYKLLFGGDLTLSQD